MKAAETKITSTSSSLQTKSEEQHALFVDKKGVNGSLTSSQQPFFGSNDSSANGYKPFFSGPTIQPKLTIGQPGDQYEQEADAMADQVVQRLSNPETLQTKPMVAPAITPLVQAKCAACEEEEKLQKKEEEPERDEEEVQLKPIFESNAPPPQEEIQRKCAACEAEEMVQQKGENGASASASPSIESSLASTKGSGSPLPAGTRQQMETSFGADFAGVRIHNDSTAVQMSKDLHAHAFTHGNDIYFNSGKYDPASNEGQKLLAHELTHTVQQDQNHISHLQRLDFSSLFMSDRELIDTALSNRDPLMVRRISNYSEATVQERISLIEIVLDQGWVGPFDESAIENIWDSFGETLPEVASNNYSIWLRSYDAGAEVDDLDIVETIKEWFMQDVNEIALRYLYLNRQYVLEEMGRFGIVEESSEQSENQLAYLQEVQNAARQVQQAQQVQQALRQIAVGHITVYSHAEDLSGTEVPLYFNPNYRDPLLLSNSDMPTWEDVKVQHDRVAAVIAGLANRYPAIYALIRDENIGNITNVGNTSPGAALSIIRTSFLHILQDIDETVPKIANGDIEYYDFVPIHQQLFDGAVSTSSSISWNNEFYKWVAQDDLSDHESREFWIQLGLSTLGAAAFVVATLATAGTATFFIAAGIGATISVGQAVNSWEHYLDLAQAARTSVTDETALVSSGQVSASFIDAILNTAFAFLDVYGPAARLVRAGTGSAARVMNAAARRELLAASERELADSAARETAQLAEIAARETGQRQATSEMGENFARQAEQRASQSLGGDAIQAIRQFISEFNESVRNWARSVFERFGFRSYQVIDEGESIALYGIRSRVLLARFTKNVIHTLIDNDGAIADARHSRGSQLGAARAARGRGDDALATVLRQNAIELSEEIGEEAAQIAITRRFPSAILVHHGSGSGTLDLVFKLSDNSFIIVEAKGGSGRLITREISAGVRAQQGTITYLRSVLGNMANRGETVANDLLVALGPPRRIRYFLSETPIPRGSAPLETTLTEFL